MSHPGVLSSVLSKVLSRKAKSHCLRTVSSKVVNASKNAETRLKPTFQTGPIGGAGGIRTHGGGKPSTDFESVPL